MKSSAQVNVMDKNNFYTLPKAIELLVNSSKNFRKFDESVDIECSFDFSRLSKGSIFKNFCLLPFGNKQKRCVIVFSDEFLKFDEFKKAGADYVFFDELLLMLKEKKKFQCSHLITTEKLVNMLKLYTSTLNSRKIFPSFNTGTLVFSSNNIFEVIANCKDKQVNYMINSFGILRCSVGRVSFLQEELKKNIYFLIQNVFKNNFPQFYCDFLKRVCLSTTMGDTVFKILTTEFILK